MSDPAFEAAGAAPAAPTPEQQEMLDKSIASVTGQYAVDIAATMPELEGDVEGEGFVPQMETVPDCDERPAEERIAELFERMNMHRRTLIKILEHVDEARPVEELEDYVDEAQRYHFSVYDSHTLMSLLERAGAIECVDEEGNVFRPEDVEPEVVVEDGVEYLQARDLPQLYYRATAAGRDAAVTDDPGARIMSMLDENNEYIPVYHKIMTLGAKEGGAKLKELADAVDTCTLVQKPRFYVQHFIEQLKKADAMEFLGSWTTTEAGKTALEELGEVEELEYV